MATTPTGAMARSRGGDSYGSPPSSKASSRSRGLRSRERHKTQWKEIRALVNGVLAGTCVVVTVLVLTTWLPASLQQFSGDNFGGKDQRTGRVTVAQFQTSTPLVGSSQSRLLRPASPNLGFLESPIADASTSLAFVLRMQRNAIRELMEERDILLKAAKSQVKGPTGDLLKHITDRANFTAIATPGTWRQRFITKRGPFAFVAFSSHRISPHVFTVLGQAVPQLQINGSFDWCAWIHPNGTRQYGHLELILRENKPAPPIMQYSTAQLRCNLSRVPEGRFQAPGERPGIPSPSEGGVLQVFFNNIIFYPYTEEAGTQIADAGDTAVREDKIVFCSGPLRMQLDTTVFMQWLNYHRFYVQFSRYYFYDAGGMGRQIRVALGKYVKSKLVSINDFRAAYRMGRFDPMASLAENSCILTHRNEAEWVALGAVDEYFLAAPGQTVKSILGKHPDSSFISHGEYRFSTQRCRAADSDQGTLFTVERLVDRGSDPVCWKGGNMDDKDMCISQFGRRKLILNPRKILYTFPWETVEAVGSGLDLPAPDLSHAYYNKKMMWGGACTNDSEDGPRGSWIVDDHVAQIAAKARAWALAAL